MNEYNKNYYRTKKGLITRIYNAQKFASLKRGYSLPEYSKDELIEWLMAKPKFHSLYEEWKKSNYKKMLSPSLDRKDDYESYTFENIEIVTWKENIEKAYLYRKNGKNNKHNKAVVQFDKDGKYINSFHSASQAERDTGVKNGNIIQVCKNKRNIAGGFRWEYKNL